MISHQATGFDCKVRGFEESPRTFFENLDGLRFIAFFVVFIAHAHGFNLYHDDASFSTAVLNWLPDAYLGVSFFFVLSGFLITWLLIEEKRTSGRIKILLFYARRVLRIWPVYFIVIILGYWALPVLFSSAPKFPIDAIADITKMYYPFFLINFDLLAHKDISPVLGVLWSVSIEEQFYLLWPIIIWITPVKRLPFMFILIIISSWAFRNYFLIRYDNFDYSHYHTLSVIGDLALGALGVVIIQNVKILKAFKRLSRTNLIIIYGVGGMLMLLLTSQVVAQRFHGLIEVVLSIFFLLVILEQNFSQKSFYSMSRFRIISKLGTYTYGLYAYHLIGIFLTIKFLQCFFARGELIFLISIPLSFCISCIISYASYEFMEKKVLGFKKAFSC
jgi:peptidoglycan/LPS O-acetylase OafA/YrhL